MFSALWIVAASTLLASLLAGCSVQKRTTTRGFHIERLAQDDAKLLAWEERRQLERQRRQNRTWWQWLLIGLGVASLFVLVYLFAAASVRLWIL